MNLKERGITVGDLTLIILIVFSTFFIFNKLEGNEEQAFYQTPRNEILTETNSDY